MKFLNWLPFGNVPEVSPQQLAKETERWQIVDVRTKSEFDEGHIEGAIHLPITAFTAKNIRNLGLNRSEKIIAICRSAHRSIPAVRKLNSIGYNACQLKGGMINWRQSGLPETSS